MKPCVVISGVNFIEAGPLTVFREALGSLALLYAGKYEVIALVHRRNLFDIRNVTYLEFSEIKSSWWKRLKFEYWTCRQLSKQLRPYLWLSMHDMTPNVHAVVRAVYCHNPAPFYRFTLAEAMLDWKVGLFTLLYGYLYRINLRRNAFVIVQQGWLRNEFKKRYQASSVIVAHPSIETLHFPIVKETSGDGRPCFFFYPAYPRTFKNMELLLEAVRLLQQRNTGGFEVWLTLAGNENPYARKLFAEYGNLERIQWLGLLPRNEVLKRYAEADCLIFPSRLETWGMPISEFQQTGKPMLIADLPYAHETVGDYTSVRFFQPDRAYDLADMMESFARGDLSLEQARANSPAWPFAKDWRELFAILLGETEGV